jgi:hypothetical protein
VTVSEKNEAQAFKLSVNPGEPLFQQIKADTRSRIQDAAISADALLPEGPYNLWHAGESSRRVKDLVGAFAQFPHLPKMLRRKEILSTLVQGAREGFFVLRAINPDRTARTYWRQEPDEASLRDPSLELVLPEAADLTELGPVLLLPNVLPGLWGADSLAVRAAHDYFAGGRVVQVARQGYEESVTVPKADREVVDSAIVAAVQTGQLWLVAGQASLCGESVPAGLLTDDAVLRSPPPAVSPVELLPDQLPAAWSGETATGSSILEALSQNRAVPLPWPLLRAALDGAFRTRMLERAVDSGPWPCELVDAVRLRVCVPGKVSPPLPPVEVKKPGTLVAEAVLETAQVQDLADRISEIREAAVGHALTLQLRVELSGATKPPPEVVQRLNQLLREVSEELVLK